MILGTHRKTSNWRSRTAATVMIIGAATLSAPLIQADAHPEMEVSEEELAGKHDTHQGTSVIKRKYKENGKTVSEHYEITVDGDDITAFEIGPNGEKNRIDVEDIEGVDVADLKAGNSHSITISDGDGVKFMSRDEFKKWAEAEYPEWKEEDFASWVEGDMASWLAKTNKGKLAFHSKELKSFPRNFKFPRFSKHSDNVFVLDSDDFPELENLKKLKTLKGLKGLEKLEALKHLEGLDGLAALDVLEDLDGFETFTVFTDNGDKRTLKMHRTQSKLAAARAMLESTQVEEDDSREMAKAKRELEKARKALKAAEKALKDAE